jgi:hypothetical protein
MHQKRYIVLDILQKVKTIFLSIAFILHFNQKKVIKLENRRQNRLIMNNDNCLPFYFLQYLL